ncbi:hypothetical protein AUJ84_03405 [Candidatus Pacearchaeota archaeon CG1_02_32_132]|nr:MAG: hypothetical protein AUJ84_03405 [Candidatus Pacearchaeota archaeon CG1_02_32_132]
MKHIFIIEHLEPKLWPWCIIEYKSISGIVGKSNLWFTNIDKRDIKKLSKYGKVFSESIKDMNLENACVLDPDSEVLLSPQNSKKFQHFIFGGILGDNPPKKRTSPELTRFIKNAETRNIGKEQFSTDNAVYVVHEIHNGKKFSDIKFKDTIEIGINKIESVILPYRYPMINKKPRISKELITYLKKHPGFD